MQKLNFYMFVIEDKMIPVHVIITSSRLDNTLVKYVGGGIHYGFKWVNDAAPVWVYEPYGQSIKYERHEFVQIVQSAEENTRLRQGFGFFF